MAVAEICIEENHLLEAGASIYYAVLDCCRALLAVLEKDAKTHKGVIHLLNENFIKTGILETEYGKILSESLKIRLQSDYDDFYVIEKDSVTALLADCHKFYNRTVSILKENYNISRDDDK